MSPTIALTTFRRDHIRGSVVESKTPQQSSPVSKLQKTRADAAANATGAHASAS
jgi:hypothetical protein